MFSSRTDQWETPKDFYDNLNSEFGFTLDPCADENNHKCKKYFTKENDGLSQCWNGERVFCNLYCQLYNVYNDYEERSREMEE